ncbi:hypothetical protein [Chitinilyticum litopenaei]|uniref:hypothetical protein n=1 Tax=Chitinilyticum litopenaei TaxID=1121276 RepID=UPI000425E23D|nr:hypothetical protein [Chitinilyticum litopenaei]
MLHQLLLDYLVPCCLFGAAFGVLAYYYYLNKLHDVVRECYPGLLEYDPHDYRVNLDQPFQALKDVPPILKSGVWRQFPEPSHIALCHRARIADRTWMISVAGLLLPFFI